jgi:nucleotide-binding universal stress UspA family protein
MARSWPADLIVIGRRGRTGLKEALMGSVSNYVVHHAPCTVMVVQDAIAQATAVPDKMQDTVSAL